MNEPRNKVCPTCKHLIYADDPQPHECPTPEYEALRDKLVSEWAQWEEDDWFDDHGNHVEK